MALKKSTDTDAIPAFRCTCCGEVRPLEQASCDDCLERACERAYSDGFRDGKAASDE